MGYISKREQEYPMIFDKENPRSIVNITSSKLSNYIRTIPCEFLDLGKEQLEEKIKPTKVDKAIKAMFWREYNRAQLTKTQMAAVGIWKGVCGESYFNRNFIVNNNKLAWVLLPNIEDEIELQLLYDKGLAKVEEILNADIYDNRGNLSVGRARVALDAFKILDDRVKGLAVQKVEKKSVNLSITENITNENRDKKIQEIKNKMLGYRQ